MMYGRKTISKTSMALEPTGWNGYKFSFLYNLKEMSFNFKE